jgi:hypothetical protein
MPLSLDEYRCKLINKILFSSSQEEVIRFCDASIKGLEHHNVNAYIVVRFVDKVIIELEQFNPMKKDAQQWSNIKLAKILFKRIREKLNMTTN